MLGGLKLSELSFPDCYGRQQFPAQNALRQAPWKEYVAGHNNQLNVEPTAPYAPVATFGRPLAREHARHQPHRKDCDAQGHLHVRRCQPLGHRRPDRLRRAWGNPQRAKTAEGRRHPAGHQASSARWETADRKYLKAAFEAAGVDGRHPERPGRQERVPDHRRRDDHQRRQGPDDRQPGLRHRQGGAGQGQGRRASRPSTTTGSRSTAARTTTSASTTSRSASCRARAWSSA